MSGGFLINPDEVDEALLSHEAVVEAVTVGIEDADFGEVPVSLVVLDDPADEASLTAHCGRLLERNKVPKRILTVRSIPRGDAGKPQMEQVRAIIDGQVRPANENAVDSKIADVVIDAASHVFRMPAADLSLDSSPGTVDRWDSFTHVALLLEVEQRTGRRLPAKAATAFNSLRTLVAALRSEARTPPQAKSIPYALMVGTSLFENALPPEHPAKDVFPSAPAEARMAATAFANQSEQRIIQVAQEAIEAGTSYIFIEINPFLLTMRFERIAISKHAGIRRWMSAGVRVFIESVRYASIWLITWGRYGELLKELTLYYPADVRAPRDPTSIEAVLELARQRGTTVVWVAMPRSQSAIGFLGSRFEAIFADRLRAFASQFKAEVWRPTHAWPDTYFHDNAHLNAQGRELFMSALREYAAGKGV